MNYTALLFNTAGVLLAGLIGAFADRKSPLDDLRLLRMVLFVLPFACGGFYTFLAPVVSAVLLYLLCRRIHGAVRLRLNLTALSLLLLAAGFALTPLWAADKGMALLGGVRFLPIALYALVLWQLEPAQRERLFTLVPLSGVLMTVLSFGLQLIGIFQPLVTVGGRMAGFIGYPNTFALFLLVGFVLIAVKTEYKRSDRLNGAVLIFGVFASGSRAALILLLAVIAYLCIKRRSLRLATATGGCLLLFIGLSLTGLINVRLDFGSLWARLLFYSDALPVIVRNPFGLGYLGYRAVLGSVQTGHYAVTYVHNGLLQLLLDVGWVPALLLTGVLIKAFFAKTTTLRSRLLLFVLLSHALVDFDMQFLLVWLLLLPLLDYQSGKEFFIRKGRACLLAVLLAALMVCSLFGAGEALFRLGRLDDCLAVTPFYTDAELVLLQNADNTEAAEALADSILQRNATCALALSAKANAAFSRGDMDLMILYKERALACDRYAIANYIDYINLLLTARRLYLQAGNSESAEICRQKTLEIPTLIRQVNEQTSPLAVKAIRNSYLELPQAYTEELEALAKCGS